MSTIVIPEKLDGEYHGVMPATLLPPGWICDGKNMRKVSQGGAWKPRQGCSLHNTTALESGAEIKSLHHYKNPISSDEHFIAQVNSKLVKESASDKLPPTQDTSFGTSLGVSVGTTPGFSACVGEYFFYADGSGKPLAWGGDTPRVKGAVCWDNSESQYQDLSMKVIDGRDDTYGVIGSEASDYLIVITQLPVSAVTFDFSTVNSNAATLSVHAWRSGSWSAVSSLSDGTSSGGATFAQDGTVSWTADASDDMRAYANNFGFTYKFSWSGALSSALKIISLTCTQAMGYLENKWDGVVNWASGCRFFDQSVGEYQECLGKVSNESTSMYVDISEATTSDYLYVKTAEPAGGIGIAVVLDYTNTAAAKIDLVEYWNGSAWTSVAVAGSYVDRTLDVAGDSSFAQTGFIEFDSVEFDQQRRTLGADTIPGFWYRLSWDGTLSTDVRIYAVLYYPRPESIPTYKGCVEFKNRLMLWGDPQYPNRLRFSAMDKPFSFSGMDSGWTEAFGAQDEILGAVKFYNELIVFKKDSIWMLEGDGPPTFGTLKITDKVGLASPKSFQLSEVGFPATHKDEPMTIVIWQDTDGVYTFDGRKPKKESYAVDQFFNPESSDCIPAANICSLQSFIDPNNNEYHLLLPSTELVYNYVTAEWYPPFEREVALTTGLGFKASNNRSFSYGGSSNGFIMRLENDTTDKNTSDADVAIEHYIKTRAISYDKAERLVRFVLRKIWAELRARDVGAIEVYTYKNQSTTGVLQNVPAPMSMVYQGYKVTVPHIETSIEDCACFQVKFYLNTADREMEIYSFHYEIGGSGISEQ